MCARKDKAIATLAEHAKEQTEFLKRPVTVFREWASPKDGRMFSARYLRPEGENVVVQREDKKIIRLSISGLAPMDAQYMDSLRLPDGSLPTGRE